MSAVMNEKQMPAPVRAGLASNRQELIILPTEKCNFRCTYCYEDFLIGAMRRETIDSVNAFISRRVPNVDVLQLSWFGGEPLLAKHVIMDITKHAFEECKKHGKTFQGGFTTNGYLLTKDLLQELVNLNQSHYQISLDGWREMHDTTRIKANGGPTFDVIWANLLAARDVVGEFNIVLRIHVNDKNFDSLIILMNELRANFSHDQRFTLNFQDVRDMGGENGAKLTLLSHTHFATVSEQLQAIFDGREPDLEAAAKATKPMGESANNFGMSMRERMDTNQEPDDSGIGYVCYAAQANSLLIRADGRIGKCTVALNDERNTIGKILPDGHIQLDQSKLQPWIRGLVTADPEDLACPYHKMPKPQRSGGLTPANIIPVVAAV